MVCSQPGSPVHGFYRQGYWSGLLFPSSGDLPGPGIQPISAALAGRFFTTESPGKPGAEVVLCYSPWASACCHAATSALTSSVSVSYMTVYICVAFLMCTAVFSFQGKGLHPEQLGWPSPVGSCHGLEIATAAAAAKSRQSCPTLCDSIDGSPPGFPVPGILQARTLEWVAISFSDA